MSPDNHFINGTKLLNVAGMTRGRRDGILKSEKTRHVVKIGPMHLKGVWYAPQRQLLEDLALTSLGSLSTEHSTLRTRRRSPTCCILCSCTTSEGSYTTPKMLRGPTPWQLQASAGVWTALILNAHPSLRSNLLHCTITIPCRVQLGARRLRLPIPLRHIQTLGGREWNARIHSRRLQQVHQVCWAWAVKPTLTNGVARACLMESMGANLYRSILE